MTPRDELIDEYKVTILKSVIDNGYIAKAHFGPGHYGLGSSPEEALITLAKYIGSMRQGSHNDTR